MAKLIGLSGYARSGKDTVGDFLVQDRSFRKVSFAQPMRDALYALNPKIDYDLRLQEIIDFWGWDGYKASEHGNEIRALMQRLGTEVGRKQFGEDFWVNMASQLIDTYLLQDMNVVVTDVRFPNEVKAIKELGGEVWRIERDGVSAANAHASETALDGYTFSRTIYNNGTLDDLREEVI